MAAKNRCFICGEENPNALTTHHLVPQRYGGGDNESNTYTLCRNCHACIEQMYDGRFWRRIHKRAEAIAESSFGKPDGSGRYPTGLKPNDRGELVPDYGDGFQAVVDALRLREDGVTLRDAAEETGIPSSTISEIEKERKDLYLALAE